MLIPAVMGLVVTAVMISAMVFLLRAWWTVPIPVLGMGGAPEQPIDFPHTVHVQNAAIQCEFCHRNVDKGEAATVPAVEQCMFCHKAIVGVNNPEIDKLLQIADSGEAINWARVHRLPDHVQFAHEPHIRFFTDPKGTSSVQREVQARAQDTGMTLMQSTCATCHGDVGGMSAVKQVRSLKMGDCVDCHSKNDAPTDCTACHY